MPDLFGASVGRTQPELASISKRGGDGNGNRQDHHSSLRDLEGWLWDERVIGLGARKQTRGVFYYLRYRHNGSQIMKCASVATVALGRLTLRATEPENYSAHSPLALIHLRSLSIARASVQRSNATCCARRLRLSPAHSRKLSAMCANIAHHSTGLSWVKSTGAPLLSYLGQIEQASWPNSSQSCPQRTERSILLVHH